ncbi:hypothetical protein ABIB68_007300 [Bradyrhizobium sp. F1.2.2]
MADFIGMRSLWSRSSFGGRPLPDHFLAAAGPCRMSTPWCWQHTGHIGQPQRADAGPQVCVAAISGIHQHHAASKPGSAGRFDLLKCDLLFKADLLGHARFVPTFVICCPILRQIETIHRRQTGVVIGKRQGRRDFAVILLAELPAILTRHIDRMLSLLGKTGVIDDPRFDRSTALHRRQYHLAHFGQNTLVESRRLADEVQQRLMLRRRPIRCCHRCHRLNAFMLSPHD